MTHDHGPAGSLTHADDETVITFTRDFAAPPDRVWQALTSASSLSSWLAPRAEIDARLGGAVRLVFDDANTVSGTITEFEPPHTLGHSWMFDDVASTVRYTLEPTAGGTRLTLVHRGLPEHMSRGYTPGWHAYVVRLDAAIDGRTPPDWTDVFEAVSESYS